MTIEEAFGLVIRRLRKERNLSQEQLSQSSSLGRAFISQLERGKQQPTLVTIFELAGALNVFPARILTEIELLLQYNTQTQARETVLVTHQSWKSSRGDKILSQASEFQGDETILLVDDEHQLRDMLSELLAEFGYNVIVAEDGQHAVDIYREQENNIKIILMDVIMPRKDGIRACQEIHTINPAAKVILMSAYTADCLGNMVPTHFIHKPMAPLDLIKKIKTTLGGESV